MGNNNPNFNTNFSQDNISLCTLYRNFLQGSEKWQYADVFLYGELTRIFDSLEQCGKHSKTYIDKTTLEEITVIDYCDNRICLDKDCQDHRGYKFLDEHQWQIQPMKTSIRVPKGFIFTTPTHEYPPDRKLIAEYRTHCRKLIEEHRITDASMHMELKMYPCPGTDSLGKNNMDKEGYFQHFHVVAGSFDDFNGMLKDWNYRIVSEPSRNLTNIEWYMWKYASKVPYFNSPEIACMYGGTVYKQNMHKYYVDGIERPKQPKSRYIKVDYKWDAMGNLVPIHKPGRTAQTYGDMKRWHDEYFGGTQ